MKRNNSDSYMISGLFFRLLPIQILINVVGAVNNIVSGLFAGNMIGKEAMSAVGLYAPINMFVGAVSVMLVGGSQVLCGKYMGKNQVDRTQKVFSLDIIVSFLFSVLMIIILAGGSFLGLAAAFTKDETIGSLLSLYMRGQAIGLIPMVLGQQLTAFLSLENRTRRSIIASAVLVLANLVLNYLFVVRLHMGAFGLALASSLGMWIFCCVLAQYFISGRSLMKFSFPGFKPKEAAEIIQIGAPGALSFVYQTARGLIVNALIIQFVGSVGLSAFTASDSVLRIFWAIPFGMASVSRMLMSVSIGEEDRKSLTDVMRTVLKQCMLLMCSISLMIILLAVPFTRMFYRDAADPVYRMTVSGFRILPLCMPLSVIVMNFVSYWQASDRKLIVHILSFLDGVVCVVGFTALLIPSLGMNSVYIANVLNGVVTAVIVAAYSVVVLKRLPRNLEELMVIPEDFGVPENERLDLTMRSMEEVIDISEQVQQFCLEKSIDERRSYLAGLYMEEMAGNVIEHGFSKDKKAHTVDIRVVHKDETVILRIKDDCVPFDPAERQNIVDPADMTRNIGIRTVYSIAEDIKYQNILGLNVLTIRI